MLDDDGKQKIISASAWLDRNKPVEQMTWAPGVPMLIHDRLISEGGWIERKGVTVFNLYRPPTIEPGNAAEADRWLDHVHKVYPDDADHIVKWLAHRVQRPQEKINHALVLGGARASARTRCSSRSSARSGRGISTRSRRSRCSAASTAS